jgi:hypothetical protein
MLRYLHLKCDEFKGIDSGSRKFWGRDEADSQRGYIFEVEIFISEILADTVISCMVSIAEWIFMILHPLVLNETCCDCNVGHTLIGSIRFENK